MEEKELITKCQLGDRRAMEKVYTLYAGKMKALCRRYSKSIFEVEDILQDGFIKAFTHINTFNQQGSFEGWLRRIMINTALNHYKKNLVYNNHLDYDEIKEEIPEPVEIVEQLSVNELYSLINQLPEGYRFVFNLYAIDGYSHKEIAEILNINESTSRSQFTRAKKSIIQLLKDYKYEEK